MESESTNPNGATRVTIEGPGVSVTRQVTDEQAAQILSVILRPAGTIPRGGAGIRTSSAGGSQPGSLSEFFRSVAPRRNPDKIVTIAHYMKVAEDKSSFLPEDILSRFKEIGEPPPGNFSRDVRWAKVNAWIALDVKTGEYYVTASGSAAVEAGFSEEVTKTTKIKPGRRSRRHAATSEPSDA